MHYKRVILFFINIAVLFFLGFSWPVEIEKGKITSIFGESRWNHFHDGIDLTSSNKKVFPFEEGKLVYCWNKSIFPLDNYPGGGNYKILSHEKDMYSLYLHLKDNPEIKNDYKKNHPLGIIANTGRSFGSHLHFSILKYKSRKSINPFKILPTGDIKDIKKPEILTVYLRIRDKYFRIKEGGNLRLTQHYPLLVHIKDSLGNNEKIGIYKLKAFLNNKKVLEIEFNEIDYSKNGLTIEGKKFHDLYDEKGYYRIADIKYQNGLNTFSIIASDYMGNETAKRLTFNIKLDM